MSDSDFPSPDALSSQRAAVLAFLRRELAAGRAPSLAEVAETSNQTGADNALDPFAKGSPFAL